MKRSTKGVLVLLLVLLQMLALCGCKALDKMRSNQVFPDENGDILWQGETYRQLPDCEYFDPDLDHSRRIYVTEPDVPVLLSGMFYQRELVASTDGQFLHEWGWEDYSHYYCRAEQHDALSKRLLEPFVPEIVCYSYTVYDEKSEEFLTKTYTLTEEQTAAIELVIQETEPVNMGEGWELSYAYEIMLEECSEDMLLRRHSVNIAVSGNTYYVFLYTDTQELIFTVPEGCKEIFTEIITPYMAFYEETWGTVIEEAI